MTTALDEAAVTAVHAPGTDITRYSPPVLEEYRARFVMQPEEAKALDRQLRECMRAVLVEGVDYGTIPGMGDKPSLFKPGAEKLIQWFGFGFDNKRDEVERDADGQRTGVTYKCTVTKELADGRKVTVATCEGYAGYDEDKFFTPAEKARAKVEAAERKWARKDNRPPKPEKWENAAEYRAPWNSVLKMAQKRALVGAAIDATAAAGLFTQDLEDMKGAVPDASAFTDAAHAKIMALPDDTRNALGRWYRERRWPEPGQWTPEQWCAVLVTAGTIAARTGEKETGKQSAPAAKTPADIPGTEGDDGDVPTAVALDPEDPWAVKVDGIATPADAETATGELAEELNDGRITEARASLIRSAIAVRVAQLGGEFARKFRERLAATSDLDGFTARRGEVNEALAGKLIPARTASELHTEVSRRSREQRQQEEQPAPDAAAQPDGDADAREGAWVLEFLARLADADAAAIRALRAEVARAVSVQKVISPQTANELFEDIKKRGEDLRSAA